MATKLSAEKLFSSISRALFLNSILIAIIAIFVFEQNFSYKKIENLDTQRALIHSLYTLSKDDLEIAKIKFQSSSQMLLIKIEQLRQLYQYDIVGKYIIFSQKEYLHDLDKLTAAVKNFSLIAKNYLNTTNSNQDSENKKLLMQSFRKIQAQLNSLYIKNVHYNQQKSQIITNLVIFALLLSLFFTYYYRKKLRLVLQDILYLSSIQPTKKNYETNTQEADAIILRMRKKVDSTIDKNLLDPVTELLNHKGLLTIYSRKKHFKENYFTSLSVLEIDNFSKTNKKYPPEVTQTILKKVAFTLSLFEQPADVIARIDYNQFVVIFSRASKEQCYKEIEMLRQNISELQFKLPNGEAVHITISGGFLIKTNNKVLEDAITQAKQILEVAKKQGGNTIAQLSDLAKLDV
jgi:diguanylate cyclase (GGDEF)-like protein